MNDQVGSHAGGFGDVDHAGSPASLVAYLDSARSSPRVVGAKDRSIEQLDLASGARALDLGCGTGEDVVAMSPFVGRNGVAIGIDSSSVMVREASRRAARTNQVCSFPVADAHRLPFKDGAFDAARTERTLQHLADPDRAVRELTRVLKPGGRLAIIEPDWDTLVIDGADHSVAAAIRSIHINRTAQPHIGRRLYGILHTHGFVDVQLEPVVMTVTSLAHGTATPGLRRDAHRAVAAGMVTATQAEAWLSDLHAADREQRFLWAIVNFCVAGRKR